MADRDPRRPAFEDVLPRLHFRIAMLPVVCATCAVGIISAGELSVVQLLAAATTIAAGACGVGVWIAGRRQRVSDRLLAAALILLALGLAGLALG